MNYRNYIQFIKAAVRLIAIAFSLNGLIGLLFPCCAQTLPIKPARTIQFTTTEGSYTNVDVSPDGKTLAFDLLGDLYTVPATGGKATQLTRGLALNIMPAFSPDGASIAYYSDRTGDFRITTRDLYGNRVRTLDTAKNPVFLRLLWSPNGKSIIFGNIAYNYDGSSKEVSKNELLRFSQDGKDIYTLSADTLYRVNTADGNSTIIAKLPKRNLMNACLSPDAGWLAYVIDSIGSRCLVGLKLKDNTSRILVRSLVSQYTISPDSKSIYISDGGKIHRINSTTGADVIVPISVDVKADLGGLDYNTFRVTHGALNVKYTRSSSVSPDGKKLVFTALNRIYIENLPDGKPTILVKQPINQYQPCWSPDSKWIAYVSWCDTVGGYLWKVPAVGGKPIKITPIAGEYQRPCWSPDGKTIGVIKGGPFYSGAVKYFAAGDGAPQLGYRDDPGIGQLELVPVKSGAIRAIADSIPLWNQLAFSADGHKIIFTPKHPQEWKGALLPEMVSKDINGNNQEVLAIGTSQTFYEQKTISPDGRFIVYSADEDLYLVPVSKLAQPTVISGQSKLPGVIRFAEGVDPSWEQGGKVLSWSYGNHFYRISPDKVIAAADASAKKSESQFVPEKDFTSTKIVPDEKIPMNIILSSQYAHGTIALKNVRIITMRGSMVIEHGTVVIKDGRFTAVGPSGIIIPKNAKIYELPGATIMPGLIDLHLHMGIPPDVFPQQSWMYLVNLAYGITTARDPSLSFDSFGYAELLNSGQMLGPRLYSVGRAVRLTDGVMRFNNPGDARAVVQKRAAFGGSEIKQYLLPTRLQRQWLLMACREQGLNMTNEGGHDLLLELGQLKDGSTGVEHNPPWDNAYNDLIQFYARCGAYFTPTLQVAAEPEAKLYFDYKYWHRPDEKLERFYYNDHSFQETWNGPESLDWITKEVPKDTTNGNFIYSARIDAKIRNAGGKVTMGSHGNDEGIGPHNEVWALQSGGISNLQALQAATIMGAEALGIQRDVGSIEIGKIADLIILNKNPLDNIHNTREIKYVMKDGILYNGDTLDELWPVRKKCPEWKLKNGTALNGNGALPAKSSGGIPGDND